MDIVLVHYHTPQVNELDKKVKELTARKEEALKGRCECSLTSSATWHLSGNLELHLLDNPHLLLKKPAGLSASCKHDGMSEKCCPQSGKRRVISIRLSCMGVAKEKK